MTYGSVAESSDLYERQVGVALRNGKPVVFDHWTGTPIGTLYINEVVHAASDGKYIAVILANGLVYLFDGMSRKRLRRLGRNHATDVDIVQGIVTISYQDGNFSRYRAAINRRLSMGTPNIYERLTQAMRN